MLGIICRAQPELAKQTLSSCNCCSKTLVQQSSILLGGARKLRCGLVEKQLRR